MKDHRARPAVDTATRVRYSVFGLIVGGLWLWHAGDSAWEHGLRLLVLMMVVPPTLGGLRTVIARRRGRKTANEISLVRLLAFKGTLALTAVAVSLIADGRIPCLDVYMAVWLALALALGGPALHHRLLTPARQQATPGTQARGTR
ncbi:hypothetical protein [Streptomyces sp. NPDC054783]